MSDAHLTQYQALPLDKDRLTLDKSLAINPTILPLDDDPEEPCHDYLEMLDLPDRHSSHYPRCRSLYRWQQLHSRRDQVCGGGGGTSQNKVIWAQALLRGTPPREQK